MEDNSFVAKTQYGYTLKTLAEILCGCLTNDVFLTLKKDGISSLSIDNKETILINLNLQADRFDEYVCKTNRIIAVNLKHFLKLIRNIKKKDSTSLFIKTSAPNKLGIKTFTDKSDGAEISYLTIRDVTIQDIDIPTGYYVPKTIKSADYQKLCKKLSIVPGKVVCVTIQENHYVSFCNNDEIISIELHIGEPNPKCKHPYKGNFTTLSLRRLIKVPSLHSNMNIYAPSDTMNPIKIKSLAGQLGSIEIYLKTKEQIEMQSSK